MLHEFETPQLVAKTGVKAIFQAIEVKSELLGYFTYSQPLLTSNSDYS